MIGEMFGNYRAIELLGEGGMGAVYLAEHPGIGRRVAVKVLHRNYTRDEQLLGRFLNEARAANAIRHPNIIEILDSGQQADGTPFLVMELLEGESLGTRLRRDGALPISVALDFAYQTASALGAAHKKQIVHRDLKPDNMFVIPDPSDGDRERIKVLDFGIAKLQQSGASDSVKTRTGTLMGTPVYMSPEQCRGTKTVDHRSDVYSLGVIFYEMMVGTPPFVSDGFGELVNMHLNVPPPSARAHRPEIPEAVEALVMKMLAKDPAQRCADMPEVRAALKASGGFNIRSSPDLGRTSPSVSLKPRDTTLTAGTGEWVGSPPAGMGARAKLAIAGVAAVAVVGVGLFLFGERHKADDTASPPIVVPTAPPPTTPPPVAKPPAEPKQVTVRLTSFPAGAKVLDAAGETLGITPLVLTRPSGGELQLRLEKEGYDPGTRVVSLDADQTVELKLEAQPKTKPRPAHKPRGAPEPAKL